MVIRKILTFDLAPEEKLFKVHFTLELTESQHDMHLLLNVESDAIGRQVFHVGCEGFKFHFDLFF